MTEQPTGHIHGTVRVEEINGRPRLVCGNSRTVFAEFKFAGNQPMHDAWLIAHFINDYLGYPDAD